MDTDLGELSSIPLPPGGEKSATGDQAAWAKANEALQQQNLVKNQAAAQAAWGQQQQQQPPYGMSFPGAPYGFPPFPPPFGMPGVGAPAANQWNQPKKWGTSPIKPSWQNKGPQQNAWQNNLQSNNWQNKPGQPKQWIPKQQGPNFQPFRLQGQKLPTNMVSNFAPSKVPAPGLNSGMSPSPFGDMPKNAKDYVERAFLAADTDEERKKVTEYLEKRMKPLIQAGTVKAVNWDHEPLPHEKNYQLTMGLWTPAAERNKAVQLHAQPAFFANKQKRRSPSPVSVAGKRGRRSSSSESDSSLVQSKKKTKKEKKLEKLKRQMENKNKKNKKVVEKWRVNDDESRREERARRFEKDYQLVIQPTSSRLLMKGQVIKGTCQDIEKRFFRLTAAPDPSLVRPPEVLEKALDNVKDKYRKRSEYQYLIDQLRSIRQDLTVQRVRNRFTVSVYEINARISLEHKDREEFNKCQSQLKLLYSELEDCPNQPEFVAYRLLYYVAMDKTLDIATLLKELTPSIRKDDCVKFALNVRQAVAIGNYVKFFRLFKDAPKMSAFIMDLFVERERKRALKSIFQGYRPSYPLSKIEDLLALEGNELEDFLKEVEIEHQDGAIDCRLYASKVF